MKNMDHHTAHVQIREIGGGLFTSTWQTTANSVLLAGHYLATILTEAVENHPHSLAVTLLSFQVMASDITRFVGESLVIRKAPPMHLTSVSLQLTLLKKSTLTECHLPMVFQEHAAIYGLLYLQYMSKTPIVNCPCTNNNYDWPFNIPAFIGNNYFCETGNRGPGFTNLMVHSDDPLCYGAGCGPTSSCCQLNSPPWFCVSLPEPTTDDLELRICIDQPLYDEDVVVSLVEIYVAFR